GGSMHLFDVSLGFLGGPGFFGGHTPPPPGARLRLNTKAGVSPRGGLFGGAPPKIGPFPETPNMASLWELPSAFTVENNGSGMGTAVARASAVNDLSVRGHAYGMPAEQIDGQDVLTVRAAMDRAAARARDTSKPTLLEMKTYRYVGHSMSDAAHGTY